MKGYKARGVVLSTVKYGDSGMVVQMLTDRYGRQSYMVQGVRSSRGRGSKMALFQPLFILQFEGLESQHSELHKIREVQNDIVFKSLPYDIRKSTIALFMAEVLYRLVGESEANEPLFDFVYNSVRALDEIDEGVANFHLWFLANLSRYFGYFPGNEHIKDCWFDMREGLFVREMPLHDQTMSIEEAELLRDLTETDLECLGEIPLNRDQRVAMLSRLVEYYCIHLEAIRSVRSIEILQEVF
uniref:DNA repair protein RecO n=1 Tax=Alistipes sp. TaxID=1872444 RepID=UPI004057098C